MNDLAQPMEEARAVIAALEEEYRYVHLKVNRKEDDVWISWSSSSWEIVRWKTGMWFSTHYWSTRVELRELDDDLKGHLSFYCSHLRDPLERLADVKASPSGLPCPASTGR